MKLSIVNSTLIVFFNLLILTTITSAQVTMEQQAKSILESQLDIIAKIEPTLERIDLARIMVIKNSIDSVLKNMASNSSENISPITFETLRLIQNLIIKYKFSFVFFGWDEKPSPYSIYTHLTKAELQELKNIYERMVTTFGYDASPYTTITSHTFNQMKKLLEDIENTPIGEKLKNELRSYWPSIGRTIAVAEQGDRPCAFALATEVVHEIRKLYPKLNQISNANDSFNLVLEFQGLIEFYAEFSQADRLTSEAVCD